MAPARRRPNRKASQPTSRVHKITSKEQWMTMLEKAGPKRIVFVQYYQTSAWTCKQMRPFFTKFSTQPKNRKAIFAEVEVDEVDDVAVAAGVKRVPCYQCYYENQLVDSSTGGSPEQLQEFIKQNLKEYCLSESGPFSLILKVAAAVGILAGGAVLASRLNSHDSGTGQDPSAVLLDLKQRLGVAQARLRALERSNRMKQARLQRKLIENLNAQRRTLERNALQASNKAGQNAGKGASTDKLSSEGGSGRQSATSRLNLEDLARLRRRKERGDVLYSDEEDALVVADGNDI